MAATTSITQNTTISTFITTNHHINMIQSSNNPTNHQISFPTALPISPQPPTPSTITTLSLSNVFVAVPLYPITKNNPKFAF